MLIILYYNLNLIFVYTTQIHYLTVSVNLKLRHNLDGSCAQSATRLKRTCWQRLRSHFSSEAWDPLSRSFRLLAEFSPSWLWDPGLHLLASYPAMRLLPPRAVLRSYPCGLLTTWQLTSSKSVGQSLSRRPWQSLIQCKIITGVTDYPLLSFSII